MISKKISLASMTDTFLVTKWVRSSIHQKTWDLRASSKRCSESSLDTSPYISIFGEKSFLWTKILSDTMSKELHLKDHKNIWSWLEFSFGARSKVGRGCWPENPILKEPQSCIWTKGPSKNIASIQPKLYMVRHQRDLNMLFDSLLHEMCGTILVFWNPS